MRDPLTLLIIGLGLIILFTWIIWPKRGLSAWWQRSQLDRKRVLLEDALKHLYDCEYKSKKASVDSLAGNLAISSEQAAELAARLEKLNLTLSDQNHLQLTDAGRSYALRVIRVHRIWERYLADETSIEAKDWHHEADIQEHKLSFEDANKLAADMGNPVYDPHGDPIPTESGELPDHSGIALNAMEVGTFGIITHIEDEPHTVYLQILALDLHPGIKIQLIQKNSEKIEFIANGNRCILAPVFAANVTVQIITSDVELSDKTQGTYRKLTDLKQNETATISGISKVCRGQQRQRLMDFGVVPGTTISIEMKSPIGDPTAYRILDAVIALRKEHAQFIYIK